MRKVNPVLGVFSLYHELPQDFIDRFATIEQKWFDRYRPIHKDTIFHSGLSLVDDTFLETLERQRAFSIMKEYRVRRFSFDIGTCYRHVEIRGNQYFGIGSRLSIDEIHALCKERIYFLRRELPPDCELAIENLNYYQTGAYEDVCEPEFYNDICKKFGLGLVLDLPHAQVTAINRQEPFPSHIRRYNDDIIREFHLSKMSVLSDGNAIDAHAMPDQEEFQCMYDLMKDDERSYDVVIECWSSTGSLITAYNALESFLNEKM